MAGPGHDGDGERGGRARWVTAAGAVGAGVGAFVAGMALPGTGPWTVLSGSGVMGGAAVALVVLPATSGVHHRGRDD
ncbi:hypothetical protein [Streptomyces tropicalis]|uniref:Integral membrane protein n=1 Tax=Streptomyces tropicalis TaxID=3034234 RepID=A0ABT6A3L5_9ACTN|nr:hypothetical protein [Streptomyces tropicalis]MDF3299234.1 hypothetical protein [Streptomyces tropicalis]